MKSLAPRIPSIVSTLSAAMVSVFISSVALAVETNVETPVAQPPGVLSNPEMSCIVGVVTGKDLISQSEGTEPETTTEVVSLPLIDGEGEQEFVVNGETVAVMMYKKQYADLYRVDVLLVTPKSDIPARGPQFNAILSDYLVNEGPAKNNGWTINPGPNATKFDYLNNQGGAFGMSHKLVKVLKAEGKWGTYPFTTSVLSIGNMQNVADEVVNLVKAGKLAESDVLGIYTAFTCTLNK